MRRMITESDVEKLDSIQPSEIEKLGAMQDPKTATAGQILTATSDGKAVYKAPAASGSVIKRELRYEQAYKLATTNKEQWGEHIETHFNEPNIMIARLRPGSTMKIDGVRVPLTAATVYVGDIYGTPDSYYLEICFSDEAISKYNITADSEIKFSLEVFYYK